MTYFKDYTMMRALVMDFGKDPKVNDIGDQYMFGDADGLSCLHLPGHRSEVYFPQPQAGMISIPEHLWRAKNKGRSSYSRMPLFVKEAIVPFGPEIQYSDEKSRNRSPFISMPVRTENSRSTKTKG